MEPDPFPPIPMMRRLALDPSLVPEDVELWCVELDPEYTIATEALSLLSADEERQLLRFRYQEDRARFAMTRAALRWVLARRLRVPPRSLWWVYGPHGRPELGPDRALSFNVSHSGRRALIGLSDRRSIGVDIEFVTPTLDWRELAPMVLTDTERAMVAAQPTGAQARSFYRIWVAKEAVVKATGLGLSHHIRSFSAFNIGEEIASRLYFPEWDIVKNINTIRVLIDFNYEAALTCLPSV